MSPVTNLSGVLLLLSVCGGIKGKDFSEGDTCNFDFGYTAENGPDTWVQKCPACGGEEQSPVNINTSKVAVLDLPVLVGSLVMNKGQPFNFTLSNDGYTVTIVLETPDPLSVQGGLLDGTYTLSAVQFCWGANDSVGSEHTLNGERFPLESQWVLHKNGEDGKPVQEVRIAQPYRLSDKPNPALSTVSTLLSSVKEPGSAAVSSVPITYGNLLADFPPDDYYCYYGSLTTPPCTEDVLWFVCPPSMEDHGVTEDVLEAFRSLFSEDGPLVNNFRPLQELNDRPVIVNSRSTQLQGNGCGSKRSGAHRRVKDDSRAGPGPAGLTHWRNVNSRHKNPLRHLWEQ